MYRGKSNLYLKIHSSLGRDCVLMVGHHFQISRHILYLHLPPPLFCWDGSSCLWVAMSSGFSRKFSFCERLSVNLHTKCKKQNWDKSIFGEWSTHSRKCIYTAHLGGDVLQQFRFPDQCCYYQDKMSSRLSFNEMSNFSPDTKLRHSQD